MNSYAIFDYSMIETRNAFLNDAVMHSRFTISEVKYTKSNNF